MNNIKNYLALALFVAFYVSFQAFAMEKESEGMSNRSGEWSIEQSPEAPLEGGYISSESGISDPLEEAQREKINKQWLVKQIEILTNMNTNLTEKLKDDFWEILLATYTSMKEFQEQIQANISIIKDMLSGRRPINIKFIRESMHLSHIQYKALMYN